MGVTSVTITLLIFMISMACQVDSKRFTMNIREKGERFQETVEINEKAQLQVYKVPAHNDVDLSDVMQDFKEGLTVYRFPGKRVCYISKLLPGEPKPQELRSNFQRARSSFNAGPITVVSRSMMPRGPYPRHLLRKEVLDFCGKFAIYKVVPYSDDSVTVEGAKELVRKKREIIICESKDNYKDVTCNMDKMRYKCSFRTRSCFYSVHCNPNQITLTLCETVHTWTGLLCCEPYCP